MMRIQEQPTVYLAYPTGFVSPRYCCDAAVITTLQKAVREPIYQQLDPNGIEVIHMGMIEVIHMGIQQQVAVG